MTVMARPSTILLGVIAGLAIGLPAAVAAPDYLDLRKVQPITTGMAATGHEKATTCIACHGANGISAVPLFPNLRGQTVDYLYWALVDYQRPSHATTVMAPLVASLGDQDLRDLAAYYASSTEPVGPPTAAPGDPDELAAGEQLYLHGKPSRGIPPCQGCHGPDGRGNTTNSTYPALRGQKADYLVAKLAAYHAKTLADSTNDFIMTGVATHLDEGSMHELAAWLSTRPLD